jgi:hypothetical protein
MPESHSVEFSLYPPSTEVKTIVHLLRKSLNLLNDLLNDLHRINPWDDRRMNTMLSEIVYLVRYQREQIEGVLCIASSDLYLYPSAFVISRTVLETNILIEYLLQSEDESERIIRYIKYLNSQFRGRGTFDENIFNSELPQLRKDKLVKNKDDIMNDINSMKESAISHGISSEIISRVGKLPDTASMMDDISPPQKQIKFRIAYYKLSKYSHGMRGSILRYSQPNFENEDPVYYWHYPLQSCQYILLSAEKLISRFADDRLDQFLNDLPPILSELDRAINAVFKEN